MRDPIARHVRSRHSRHHGWVTALAAMICVVVLALGGSLWLWHAQRHDAAATNATSQAETARHPELRRGGVPEPEQDTPLSKAKRAVSAMSLDEQAGQLVMAPLYAGSDPSTLQGLVVDRHVGSVLIIGNWQTGTAGVRQATDTLQGYSAGSRLLIATDQEGGQVQHLSGEGFDAMPSALEQGSMPAGQLRSMAKVWGGQLAAAGINVDLAPVLDTVTDRASNAPIGALDRDFGLDADGNAEHGIAFVEGMHDAGIEASIKHYPGLGAVSGNTDFTTDGITDVTTTLDGPEIGAFTRTIREAHPGMVMMSLATYQNIDGTAPAAFSSAIIDGYLRGVTGYDGVVTSDSLSATALSGIPVDQLGVRLIDAGGDLACIGVLSYVEPILNGMIARANADAEFAQKITRSAIRVMTLKYRMGLAD